MQLGLPLTFEEQNILQNISGLSLSLGLCKALYENDRMIISHMPISLYPYLISASTYNKLKQAHYIWQKLFVKLVHNKKFVSQLSQKFCKDDALMQKILNIYLKTQNNQIGIACSRVDYMGDQDPNLVEFNLMSVGLNGMSDKVQILHNTIKKYKEPIGKFIYPENNNQKTLCSAFIKALSLGNLTAGIILMVVHQKQFNFGDHHAFKLQMLKHGRIVESITFHQLIQKMEYNQTTKVASLENKPIDAFYFRTGYKLQHFPTEQHWVLRQNIQKSCAIKFPSLDMILVNSKRFQSQLASKNILQQYLNKNQTNLILQLNGQIHHFDNKTQQQIKQLIQKTKKEEYVLKPNRQGGGNNFFGQKAHKKLKELYSQKIHLKNYILMKKIPSTSTSNYFIFDHKPFYVPKTVAQFSTLGCFVYKQGKIFLNEMGGTLVRLKRQEANEGGIAINQGAISGTCIINYNE